MNKPQKLTLICYFSSLALILAATNLVRADEVSNRERNSFNSSTAVSLKHNSEKIEIIHQAPQSEQQVALSTGSSDKKTTDGKTCACMGYSNFCLNCQHSPEVLG